nr:putative RNA-directed DNA polymerase, eukaryota, reverse transcriptase zinc-binding domain protein [Tanacetum cinerariifolium]
MVRDIMIDNSKVCGIFHSWFDHIVFEKVVKDKWDDITGEVLGQTKSLHTKLKDLKSHLKIWYSHTKEVETSRMNLLLADMRNLDQKIDEGLTFDEDKSSRISKLQELDYFEKMNSLDLMQKARVKDIKEAFLNFYKKKFSCHDSQVSFPSFMLAHLLNTSDHNLLEAVVSMEEIKTTVWDCGSNKAPGPDGYSFLFIKRLWDLLKHDIHEFVVSFFSSGKFPQGVNFAIITLIPKVSNPLFIKDYRPISLIGLHYKIVAKIISNRLSKVVDSIISPEQSAFISGQQILDGPLILSEIIDWYKKRKKKLVLFKVDFEKAFDYVSWKYLDYMLHKLGFGSRWRTWINNCLMSARTSILINESPTSEFSLKRGLRQGDHLSPFLFIIVKEGLHMALNDGIASNVFHEVRICSNIHLSHHFYADNVIILSYWNQNDMENITRILNIFYIASGLKINFHKSNVFGVEVSNSEVVSMAACTGCEAANLLSIGGRLTLIKSVLGSLVTKASSKKLSWVKWSNTLASFGKGGLGVGSLSIDLGGCQTSGTWAKIVGTINHLHCGIIDYSTLKTIKIASLVNVFLMVHGNEIGVGLLLWEDPRPNLITLSSTFLTWKLTTWLNPILAFGLSLTMILFR